jgi:glycosyltransferase involved in cell wall biosynthesis
MVRVVVLTPKNIFTEGAGDSALSRLLVSQLAGKAEVTVVSYDSNVSEASTTAVGTATHHLLPKPSRNPARLSREAFVARRSIIHARYRSKSVAELLRDLSPDVVIGEHAYMADVALNASGSWKTVVNNHVSEAAALRRGGFAARMLSVGLARDEVRVNRRADASFTFDEVHAQWLAARGVNARVLDIVLPPVAPLPSLGSDVLFVGDQRWAPNREAVVELFAVAQRLQSQGLSCVVNVVGAPPREAYRRVPANVVIHGYVDDIDGMYARARCVVAPVRTGGGVRVKILDAACRGIPVITTQAGAGDIQRYLPLDVYDDLDALASAAALYLADHRLAHSRGEAVWRANLERWTDGAMAESVLSAVAV